MIKAGGPVSGRLLKDMNMATNFDLARSWAAREKDFPLMAEYTCRGFVKEPSCDDLLELRLLLDSNMTIVKAGFSITESACPPVRAAAAYVCSLCENLPLIAAYTIRTEKLIPALSDDGSVNEEHKHCLMMAELALKNAILDGLQQRKA